MKYNPYNLLRRTFLIVAAAASVAALPNAASAGNLTKADGTSLCTSFDSITLGPNGLVINNCLSGTTTGTGAGTFTIGVTTQQIALNTFSANNFTITRSSGSTGASTVTFDRAGGCGPAPLTGDSVTFADGQLTANAAINTPNNDATCTITLKTASAGTIGSPSMAYVLVGAGAGKPPGTTTTPPPGPGPGTGAFNCPTLPTDGSVVGTLPIIYGGGINGFMGLNSGQIAYGSLPALSTSGAPSTGPSGNIAVAITTGSPQSGTVEVSISHCPGVIDTNGTYAQGTTAGKCYASFPIDQNVHNIYWFETPGQSGPAATDSFATQYAGYGISVCEAYASNGPWYVSTRYTFPGGGSHNMAWQWQLWGNNP